MFSARALPGGRPGVTIGEGSHKHDEFDLIDDGVKHRYSIDASSVGHHAIPHGTLTNALGCQGRP